MKIGQLILEALESLSANKMRTSLTMLGIIIGVAAVVAMLAIGTGAQNAINEQINSIGTNLLYVMPGGDANNPQPLTLDDAEAIADPRYADSIAVVAPVIQGQMIVSVPGESTRPTLYAVTPEYFSVQSTELSEGQLISQANLDNFDAVALIGTDVAEDLFDRTENLLGERIRMNGQVFKVIGVLKKKGGTGLVSLDNQVIVPLTTAKLRLLKRNTPGQVDILMVQAASSEKINEAEEDISQVLRARHIRSLGEDDFDIMSTASLLEIASSIMGIMTAFLGGIAGVSLLVGGIGIMNIMLVTVTERTREIGLRQAVGATPGDIQTQFLLEALMLSLLGGLLGVLGGVGGAQLFGQLSSMRTVIVPYSIVLSFSSAALIGIAFGFLPARKAAQLDPIEALRHE